MIPFHRTSMTKREQAIATQVWREIRELQIFTVDAIATRINLAVQDVQGYIFWLCQNRYLKYGHDQIELIKNTGELAPIALKTGFLDPNVA